MSLAGQRIAITGALSRKRDDYIQLIQNNGGTFAPSVTKKVTHLIAAEPNGDSIKLTKARDMGITVVGEDYLINLEGNSITKPALALEDNDKDKPKKETKSRTTKLKTHYAKKLGNGDDGGNDDELQANDETKPKLSGMIIALTGRLSKSKEEYGKIIASHGGTLAGTVTKKTTHVVARESDGASDKLAKARKYGAQIMAENFLLNLGEPIAGVVAATSVTSVAAVKKSVSKKARPVEGQQAPTVTKMQSPPEVLLAQKYEAKKHGSMVGWWVSEKLDGVRAWWDGKQFWSRTGNLFYAPDWFRDQMPKNCILDGELFIGRKKFRETVSIVKSHSMSERWKELTYMVFDIPSEGKRPFEERLQVIRELIGNAPNIRMVDQRPVTDADNLEVMLSDIEKLGAEGLMLRKPKSEYIGKRSDTLLKMKTFTDDDARVIGYATEGKGRLAGTTGSLMVEDRNGVKFDVGSGLDDETRKNPPPIGAIITFRYQEKSESSGRPRFPVFVGLAIDKEFP